MVTGHDDCKMFPDHEFLGKVAKIKRFWSKLFHFVVREKREAQKPPGLIVVDDILTLYL